MARKKEEATDQVDSRAQRVLASEAMAKVKKKWGSNIVTLASDEKVREKFSISSGSVQLDWALGGGWSAGRINTILRPEVYSQDHTHAQRDCAGAAGLRDVLHVEERGG